MLLNWLHTLERIQYILQVYTIVDVEWKKNAN